ncbi:hypothetical protein HGRIS_001240 [Hohenbuehelia grisea]|uniref:NADH dehydrogenase subunit 5 n=1 Tax=Hohenbuehelia grisea TaxID=104357 RepID=A0ABR3JQ82_9AGAR
MGLFLLRLKPVLCATMDSSSSTNAPFVGRAFHRFTALTMATTFSSFFIFEYAGASNFPSSFFSILGAMPTASQSAPPKCSLPMQCLPIAPHP